MEWLKLDLRNLRSPAYIGSEPIARATWLNLMAYCAEQENGGRIVDCSEWKDRMWQQLVGVTLEEVRIDCPLYRWEDGDLIVAHYPTDTESMIKARREAGRKGGESFASSKTEANGKQTSDFASTEQSRAEQTREDQKRAEQRGAGSASGCGNLRLEDAWAWIDSQNGKIPDKKRARNLAKELIEEMTVKGWRIDGQPVANPMGLLINRLRKDKAITEP